MGAPLALRITSLVSRRFLASTIIPLSVNLSKKIKKQKNGSEIVYNVKNGGLGVSVKDGGLGGC